MLTSVLLAGFVPFSAQTHMLAHLLSMPLQTLKSQCCRPSWFHSVPKLLHWLPLQLQSSQTPRPTFSTFPPNFMAGRRSFHPFLSSHPIVWSSSCLCYFYCKQPCEFFSNHKVNDQGKQIHLTIQSACYIALAYCPLMSFVLVCTVELGDQLV